MDSSIAEILDLISSMEEFAVSAVTRQSASLTESADISPERAAALSENSELLRR